jgi:putative membrane protein
MRLFRLGLVSLLAPVPALAQAQDWDRWPMHPMWGIWSLWGFAMMAMMLLFWGVVITGIVLGIRWMLSTGRLPRADAALDILRQRYARGEIDREEFEARKRDLG